MLGRIGLVSLRLGLAPRLAFFRRRLLDPEAAQDRLLRRLVRAAAGTEYGRIHRLEAGDSYEALRSKLPIVGWERLATWVERQQRDEAGALAPEPVRSYGRSAGGAKSVPYTRGLRRSFQRTFMLWLGDALANGPTFRSGRTFAVLSPSAPAALTARGVPVGPADDSGRQAGWLRRLLRRRLAVSPAAADLRNPEALRYALALHLAASQDLEILSAWSPSSLLGLLELIDERRDKLLGDLWSGAVELEGVRFELPRPDRARLRLLERGEVSWAELWPELKLVSCWADAEARPAAARLRSLLPQARLQPKGLLATEAPLTLPLVEAEGCVPLVDEVFFEFESDRGAVLRLHELEPGETYGLVISQKGGLMRYRLGDRVRVAGSFGRTPCLEFAGRAGSVSDLAGERLHEGFVREALAGLAQDAGPRRTLVPRVPAEGRPSYVLVVDRAESPERLAVQLDAALMKSPGYREARLRGGLEPPTAAVRPGHESDACFVPCPVEGRRLLDGLN